MAGAVTAFRCADGCDGDGGNGDASSDPWTATVAFPTAGSVPYECEIHGGQGMQGTITVVGSVGTPVIELDADRTERRCRRRRLHDRAVRDQQYR